MLDCQIVSQVTMSGLAAVGDRLGTLTVAEAEAGTGLGSPIVAMQGHARRGHYDAA